MFYLKASGKTSIVNYFCNQQMPEKYKPTVGYVQSSSSFFLLLVRKLTLFFIFARINLTLENNIKIPDLPVKITDHEGDFAFFDNSKFDCIFFVFDIANSKERTLAFENQWKRFLQPSNENLVRIVVANKCDLIESNRLDSVVNDNYIIRLARMNGIPFVLTSAKTSYGLQKLSSTFLEVRKPIVSRNTVFLKNNTESVNSGCNC